MQRIIGIDFGTTNSVLSVLEPDGSTRNADFGGLDVFRSVLCFWMEQEESRAELRSAAGPSAIEAYLDDPLDSRLIMSMKILSGAAQLHADHDLWPHGDVGAADRNLSARLSGQERHRARRR